MRLRAFEWRTYGQHSLTWWVLLAVEFPFDYRASDMVDLLDRERGAEGIPSVFAVDGVLR